MNNNYWLISSNDRIFSIADCLKDCKEVDWRGSFSPSVGDIVFIYRTKPHKRICYMMEVTKIKIPYRNTINDIKYWGKNHSPKGETNPETLYHRLSLLSESESSRLYLKELQQQGMKGVPQGPRKLSGKLLDYILSQFYPQLSGFYELEVIDQYYEGALKKVYVDRYERDYNARNKCLEIHGCKCVVCGMTFESIYGEVGRGFIHVHHTIPISTIGQTYQIDPEKDLVPICPNCHAMLHRKDPPYKVEVKSKKGNVKSKKGNVKSEK